jgi:hypothetical protein
MLIKNELNLYIERLRGYQDIIICIMHDLKLCEYS